MSDSLSLFASGAEAAAEASKRPSFSQSHFLSSALKSDKDTVVVRFLYEYENLVGPNGPINPHVPSIIQVDYHNMIPVIPRPDWLPEGRTWASRQSCVCRKTKAANGGELWRVLPDSSYEGCYVCNNWRDAKGKPYGTAARQIALCCVREEVRNPGQPISYKDKLREVEDDGKTVVEKDIVIAKYAFSNFWSQLVGYGNRYGTILDRDYEITRIGEGLETDYRIIPCDPVPFPTADGQPILNPDGSRKMLDLRDPEARSLYETDVDLGAMLVREASLDYQRRRWDASYVPEVTEASSTEPEQAKPASDASADEIAAMQQRVVDYAPPADGSLQTIQ